MTTIMIEGFEHIVDGYELTADEMQFLFLGLQPDKTAGWFSGASDKVAPLAGGGRIANQCLRFSRSAGTGDSWASVYAADIGFSFSPRNKVCLGYAVKFSVQPTEPIPLVTFRYDNGSEISEQCTLWAGVPGCLFFAESGYNADYDLSSTLVSMPETLTMDAAIRYGQWAYIEILLDYSGTTPAATLYVNGDTVLARVELAGLRKMSENYVSQFRIINPTNNHFNNVAFNQDIDDLFLNNGVRIGPQQIIPLTNDTVIVSQWSAVPNEQYDGTGGVTATETNFEERWNLSDLPTGSGIPTAIGVHIVAKNTSGLDAIQFGFKNTAGYTVTNKAVVSEGAPDRCYRFVTDNMPVTTPKTEAGVNALLGYLKSTTVL